MGLPRILPGAQHPDPARPGFTEQELSATDHFVILSKTLSTRLFPTSTPIGERLQLDRGAPGKVGGVVSKASQGLSSYLIVGVAADVKNGGLAGESLPEYYRLRRNSSDDWQRSGAWGGSAILVIRSVLPAETIAPWIRAQVATIDPTLPVDIATLQQRVSKLADAPRFQTLLVGFFAATGLALTVIGLYGVIAFLVIQRTQEIGIRMALGADRSAILRFVLGKSLRLILTGTALGLLVSLLAARILTSLLFSISPHDPLTFTLVPLVLILIALAATFIPANSATRVNPIVALRHD